MRDGRGREDSLESENGMMEGDALVFLLDHRSDNESTGEQRRRPSGGDRISPREDD